MVDVMKRQTLVKVGRVNVAWTNTHSEKESKTSTED